MALALRSFYAQLTGELLAAVLITKRTLQKTADIEVFLASGWINGCIAHIRFCVDLNVGSCLASYAAGRKLALVLQTP